MIRYLFLLWGILNLLGCGYTASSSLPGRFKTIYIKPFVNKIDLTKETQEYRTLKTYHPLLETDITQAVIERFIFDGRLKVVPEEEADLILTGELIEYRRDSLRYTDSEDIQEYRINLIVNLALWDKQKEKFLWKEPAFFGDTTYFKSGALAKSESQAIEDAIEDLAQRIVEKTVEVW